MTAIFRICLIGAVLACMTGRGWAQTQEPANSTNQSLGDVARQMKQAKGSGAGKVFTNDNIPKAPEGQSAPAATPSNQPGNPGQGHDQAYYREQMAKLEAQLETHQRELAVLEQKLNLNQVQYYPDPQKSLMQQYSRNDINKLTVEVEAKKHELEQDEKAMDDLRDQLRRDGGDPSWLRNVAAATGGTAAATPPASTVTVGKPSSREAWESAFRAAREGLTQAKEQQQLAEDELNLLQIQQVRELEPGRKQDFTDQVQAKQQEVDQKKSATAAARKALDHLEQEFKDSGAPADWRPAE